MNRKDVQRRLIASESYWFGGVRDVPKVYETGTRHLVEPIVARDLGTHVAEQADAADYFEVSVDPETGRLSSRPAAVE